MACSVSPVYPRDLDTPAQPRLTDLDDGLSCNSLLQDNICPYLAPADVNNFYYKNSSYNIMHINCRSIKQNFDEIGSLINTCNSNKLIDICAVTETWLSDSDSQFYKICNYDFVTRCRPGRRGGGVGFYIRNGLLYNIITDLCFIFDYIECLTVEVTIGSVTFTIACIYRPPNSSLVNFQDQLNIILNSKQFTRKNGNYIILGDFNLDLLKHENHNPTNNFLSLMNQHFFLPLTLYPTRIAEFSKTLIDNIFVSTASFKCKSCIVYTDISDHLPIVASFAHEDQKHPSINSGNVSVSRHVDFFCVRENLKNIDWNPFNADCQQSTSPNLLSESFTKMITNVIDSHTEIKNIKKSKSKTPFQPWMSKGLLKSRNRKNVLYKQFLKNPGPNNKALYASYSKFFKKCCRKAKEKYFTDKFAACAGNSRLLWKTINESLNKSQSKPLENISLQDNGNLITDKKQCSELLNKYFSAICTTESDVSHNLDFINHLSRIKSPSNSFSLHDTTPDEIIRIVNEFKPKTSAGIDGLSIKQIKAIIHEISGPVSHFFNCLIRNGAFPSNFKISKIIPIFKSGSRQDPGNYRPISIIPSLAKVFEKIICLRLSHYFESKQLLCNQQYGFRSNSSTQLAVLDLQNQITTAIDNHEVSLTIFLDLARAFDSLEHRILLRKLDHYGIRGLPLKLISSFLQGRNQYVSIDDFNSTYCGITRGLPQGSTLSPLLFLIFINDIIFSSNILHFILFADDTSILLKGPDIGQLIKTANKELTKVNNWLQANKLKLNIAKCNYMIFKSKNVLPSCEKIYINNTPINLVSKVKFLGVYLDENMSWSDHIDHVCAKLATYVGILCRLKNIIPKMVLRTLYFAFMYPHIIYCIVIWGAANSQYLKKLEIINNRAIRFITNSKYNTPINSMYTDAGCLKITDIYNYNLIQFFFKLKNNILTPHLSQHINFYQGHNLRNTIIHTYNRTAARQKHAFVAGPIAWNNLPAVIQNASNISQLKRKYRKYLLSSYCNNTC